MPKSVVACPQCAEGVSPFILFLGTLTALGVSTVMYLMNNKPSQKKQRAGRKAAKAGRRNFIIGGNWKCETNCAMVDQIMARLNGMGSIAAPIEVYVCPPMVHTATVVSSLRTDIAVSSQDCGALKKYGAYTGDAFPGMLKDLGCEFVLVGHSERRQYQKESSALIAEKAAAALAQGLGAVVCIGESKQEREAGVATLKKVLLDDQMAALVKAVGKKPEDWANIVIAYEPVWAIGTGLSATPKDAQETHKIIRDWVAANVGAAVAASLRIQYGGSVKGATAEELATMPDIDGFLVGGSSLKDDFLLIIENAEKGLLKR